MLLVEVSLRHKHVLSHTELWKSLGWPCIWGPGNRSPVLRVLLNIILNKMYLLYLLTINRNVPQCERFTSNSSMISLGSKESRFIWSFRENGSENVEGRDGQEQALFVLVLILSVSYSTTSSWHKINVKEQVHEKREATRESSKNGYNIITVVQNSIWASSCSPLIQNGWHKQPFFRFFFCCNKTYSTLFFVAMKCTVRLMINLIN